MANKVNKQTTDKPDGLSIKLKSGSVANNKITIALDSNATKQLFVNVRDKLKAYGITKNKDIVTIGLYQVSTMPNDDIKAVVDKLTQ